jgi:lysophospholipase L1-like esterase
MKFASLLFLVSAALLAQQDNALLSNSDAEQLDRRIIQLMESTGAALPELQLATAPLVAGAKNSFVTLQRLQGNGPAAAEFLRQTRAFIAIADATPKPYPFPDAARKQFVELRESYERLESHFAALIERKEVLVRNPDPSNLKRYEEANTRIQPPGNGPRVVFFGDSITDFWHLNEYFTGRDFINRGIGGQVTTELLGRFKSDVIDLHPQAVIILAGTNDISRGTPLSVIENNFVIMSELAKLHQIKLLIATVLPVSDYHMRENPRFEMTRTRPLQTIRELNHWIEAFCLQSGATYVDYFTATRDPAGYLQADLADDGLHPNGQGYRIMAPIALKAIDQALGAKTVETPQRKRRFHLERN